MIFSQNSFSFCGCVVGGVYIHNGVLCMLGCIHLTGLAPSCKHSTHCAQQGEAVPYDACAKQEC